MAMKLVMQREASECGLACLATVASHFGLVCDIASARRLIGSYPFGMSATQLVSGAARAGLFARAIRVEMLDLGKLELPAVLHWKFDHYVVLKSIKKDGRCVILDPAVGERNVSSADVSRCFTGVCFEFYPSESFSIKKTVDNVSLLSIWTWGQSVSFYVKNLLLISVLIEIASLAVPLIMKEVVDLAVTARDLSYLNIICVAAAMALIAQAFASRVRLRLIDSMRMQFGRFASNGLFGKMMSASSGFFRSRSSGNVLSKYRSLEEINESLSASLVTRFLDVCVAGISVSLMLMYDVGLAAISIIAVVLYALVRFLMHSRSMVLHEELLASRVKIDALVLETVRGIDSIKIHGRHAVRQNQLSNVLSEKMKTEEAASLRTARFRLLADIIFSSSLIVTLWIGSTLVMEAGLTLGVFLAFLFLRVAFVGRFTSFFDGLMSLKELSVHTGHVADILNDQVVRHDAVESSNVVEGHGDIVCSDLSFRYSSDSGDVISDFNYTFRGGKSTAIAGPSGCGKTTLVRLLSGLIAPTSGLISVSGSPLLGEGAAVQHRICAVLQEDVVFYGSVFSNVTLWESEVDLEEVEYFCGLACIADDIKKLPMGFSTPVGEGGVLLSSGQKQRLLLARALYFRPRILILDEGTSHLDELVEDKILRNISELNITRIHVSHRRKVIDSSDFALHLEGAFKNPSRIVS